jgi:hypothetical protein
VHFHGPCATNCIQIHASNFATGIPRDTQRLTWDRALLYTASVVLDFLPGILDDSVMTHVTCVDIMTSPILCLVPATLNVDFLKDKLFVMKPAAKVERRALII